MQGRANVERARAFRTVKFMTANGYKVRVELLNVRERLLAKPLDRVGMEKNSSLATECAYFGDGLNGPDLIVRSHDGNERGLGTQGLTNSLQRHPSVRIDRQVGHVKAFLLPQVFARMQHRVMLYTGCHDVPAFFAQ